MDGRYRCDRAPAGPVNVRIDLAPAVLAAVPMELRRWVSVLRGPTTPLRMTTNADASTRFDFDLRPRAR
jgi:hypothetical protein